MLRETAEVPGVHRVVEVLHVPEVQYPLEAASRDEALAEAIGGLLRPEEEEGGPCGRRKAMSKDGEVGELLRRWHNAVTRLWNKDVNSVASGLVECPCYSITVGKITVSLSKRGLDVTLGSEAVQLDNLIYEPQFKLSDFKAIREFVTKSIQEGKKEVAKLVAEREKMLASGFDDFKKEIAEWNLQCDKGQDV